MNLERVRAKRVLRVAAILGALAVAAIGLRPWMLGTGDVRSVVLRQLSTVAGLELGATGDFTIALLPYPRIKLEGVSGSAPDGTTLTADSLRGGIRLLPLLQGELVLRDVLLIRPRIVVGGSSAVTAAELFRGGLLLSPDRLGLLPLRAVRLRAAEVVAGGLTFSALDGDILLDPGGTTMTASVTGVFKEQTFAVEGKLGRETGGGSAWSLAADVRSTALDLSTSGRFTAGAAAAYQGRLKLRSQHGVELARWLGLPQTLPGPMRGLSIEADLSLDATQVDLRGMTFEADGNRFNGVATIRDAAGRPAIMATLHADESDLSGYLSMSAMDGHAERWSTEPFHPDPFGSCDLDLRLSTARLQIGRATLSDAAVFLACRHGRLELVLADSRVQGGAAKGRLALSARDGELDVRGTMSVDGVTATPVWLDPARASTLSGIVSGQVTFEGRGNSLANLMRQLDGRGSLQVRDGEFGGIDLIRFLQRVDRQGSSLADLPAGRTPFETLSATLRLHAGVIEVGDGLLKGNGVTAPFSGVIDPERRELGLVATALSPRLAIDGRSALEINLRISGPWSAPRIVPDLVSVVRRS